MTTFGDLFLAEPGWFPRAAGAAPRGDRELLLSLPGGPFRLRGLDAPDAEALRSRFAAYEIRAGSRDTGTATELRVLACGAERFRSFDTRGWEYTLDIDYGPSSLRVAGRGLMAELALGSRDDNSLWTAASDPAAVAADCENALRLLCAYRLLEDGAAMVHAAGVAASGAGAVAVGHSGAGKTTFSRLAQAGGAKVLSDDLVALRPQSAGVRVEQLPFGGDLGPWLDRVPPVPLAALLRLEQAPADELVPLHAAEAVAMLLSCSPVVNVDPHRRDRLFDVIQGIVAAIAPARRQRLRFRRDGHCWDLVARLLAAPPGERGEGPAT